MTTCRETRNWLLESDASEWGETSADRERERDHLNGCDSCQALATRILRTNAMLDEVLSSPGPGVDSAALIARARLQSEPARSTLIRRTASRRWLVLAAAAALGALTLWGEREPRLPGTTLAYPSGPDPVVHATTSDGVAVFQTDNPDITVLWFY